MFNEIVNDEILKITFACKMVNSYGIEFEWLDSSEDSIGQLLILNNLAVEIFNMVESDQSSRNEDANKEFVTNSIIVSQIKQAQGLAGITSEMSEAEVMETFLNDDSSKEAGDINEAVMNYNPSDEARTCKFVRQGFACRWGENCPYDHTPLRKGEIDTC